MKRIGVVCMLLVLIILVMPSSVLSVCSGIESNEVVNYSNSLPPDVEIVNVPMSDHNIKCTMLGGQVVPIGVEIQYQHNATITKPFSISIFLDQFDYIGHQNITEDMINEGINRIHFNGVLLNTGIGKHTLDAYVNYDVRTRNYCEFYTTPTGFGPIHPVWKLILDHYN